MDSARRPGLHQRLALACVLTALALPVPLAGAATAAAATRNAASPSAGEQLFTGRTPIPARLDGHTEPLPPAASRCSNCHDLRPAQPSARAIGPQLNGVSLTGANSRRAGPPSRFDAASFCRALREGIDPVLVTLRPTMPRYQISDTQCTALWSYLVTQ